MIPAIVRHAEGQTARWSSGGARLLLSRYQNVAQRRKTASKRSLGHGVPHLAICASCRLEREKEEEQGRSDKHDGTQQRCPDKRHH